VQPHTHFISDPSELDPHWFDDAKVVGITGATSTPRWLMEEVRNSLTP
jgi:4-hydroxy-3-methylbut-2-enyl diphosphate reductase